MATTTDAEPFLTDLWDDLGGPPELLSGVEATGARSVLPSVFDVSGFATATVAAADLALAELVAVRTESAIPGVRVDRRAASAAFSLERLMAPVGWELPPVWDPVAGDYRCADGWIRLHTNYHHHLGAVRSVLGVAAEREAVAVAVARWSGDDLERAVIEAGGCAAVMRSVDAWCRHPAGKATRRERPVRLGDAMATPCGDVPDLGISAGSAALTGIRVIDLTRVIAGPVATGFLAAHGAEVIRVDPPGFSEVAALLPVTTAGKRCAALDLTVDEDRERFEALVADAHVVVTGLRPGAVAGLGYDPAGLRAINPTVVTVTHDAYGWSGPWSGRRGFDSLVQMSTGIAAAGAEAVGADSPVPLPVQALDHGTGHLLAAATCRALTRLAVDGAAHEVRGSLVGAANALTAAASPGPSDEPAAPWTADDTVLVDTAWGPMRRVPVPGHVEGQLPTESVDAGPLGRHRAAWA